MSLLTGVLSSYFADLMNMVYYSHMVMLNIGSFDKSE